MAEDDDAEIFGRRDGKKRWGKERDVKLIKVSGKNDGISNAVIIAVALLHKNREV